jgi:hypothetical protein
MKYNMAVRCKTAKTHRKYKLSCSEEVEKTKRG